MVPMIIELRQSILTPDGQDVSKAVFDAFPATKTSVANIHSTTFKNNARNSLRSSHVDTGTLVSSH